MRNSVGIGDGAYAGVARVAIVFTPQDAKLGVLLVKLRTRLLGPLATLAADSKSRRPSLDHNAVDAAFHQVDSTLDQLCAAVGLQPAA